MCIRDSYSSCTALTVNKGDVIKVFTATGGGYGKPADRPMNKVREDIKNGYITKKRAQEIYGLNG